MNNKATKFTIINNIWKRTGKVIPRMQIRDAATIIENYISDEIRNKRSLTVENFGTFSPKIMTFKIPSSDKNIAHRMIFIIHGKFKIILKNIKKEFG